jgi:hypothetical protein
MGKESSPKMKKWVFYHFNILIWQILCSSEIRDHIAKKDEPASKRALKYNYSWRFLERRAETVIKTLQNIAKSVDKDCAKKICELISAETDANDEIVYDLDGPWDPDGEIGFDYGSGICSNCGRRSDYLIDGLCPRCR